MPATVVVDGAKAEKPLARVQNKLGYSFRDLALVRDALTNASYAEEHQGASGRPAQLAFVGEAMLNLAATELVVERYGARGPGELLRLREQLIEQSTLSAVSTAIGLPEALHLGSGGVVTGPQRDDRRAVCAVVAAVAADADRATGLSVARRLLEHYATDCVDASERADASEPADSSEHADAAERAHAVTSVNYKGILQEELASRGAAPPSYEVVGREGPDHEPVFTVVASHEGMLLGRGSGAIKKAAEQRAAKAALDTLHAGGAGPA